MTTGNKQYTDRSMINGYQFITKTGSNTGFKPSNGPYILVGRQWSGGNRPDYKQVIASGKGATNNYDLYVGKVVTRLPSLAYAANTQYNVWSYQRCFGHGNFGHAGFDSSVVTRLTNEAYSKLHEKIADARDSYNGFEFLAEFHKAVKMIRHPAEALAGYLNRHAERSIELRRKSEAIRQRILRSRAKRSTKIQRLNREARHLAKVLASLRLEVQYGWKPFISELEGIASSTIASFPTSGAVKVFKSVRTDTTSVTYTDNITIGDVIFDIVETRNYEYTVELKARQTYTGQYDGMGSLRLLAARGGFRKDRLIPLLWELTPLSVFVDMFVNVGDVLNACMTETSDLSSVDRYVTRKVTVTKEIRPRGLSIPWPAGRIVYTRDGITRAFHKHYSREKWFLGIPPISFTTPAIGSGQFWNLSALATNASLKY